MTVEMVFFDAGETILHPHPSFPELFSRTCKESGRDVEATEVHDVQSRLAPHLLELARESGVEAPSLSADASMRFWTYLYRRFLNEFGIDDEKLARRLFEVFSDSASYRLFDDVLPVLAELSGSGYRIGLISNFEGWLEKLLVELEVGHLFDTSVISGVAGVEKPDPRIYEMALERAGLPGPQAVHVGDSPALDVVPARSVGMTAVLLDRLGRYPSHDEPRIASLEDLPAVLSKF